MILKAVILRVLYLLIAWVKSGYFFSTAILIVAFYKFLDIAWNVLTKDKITVYDEIIVQFINQLASPSFTEGVVFITNFGGMNTLSVLLLVAISLLLVRKLWTEAILVTGSTLGGTVLMFALKDLFHRARPVVGTPIIRETGYSFPSGHTTISMCFYGILLYLVFRYCKPLWLKCLLSLALTYLIGMVGLSRVYLGVHYPSDVWGGFLLGLFWLSLCVFVYQLSLVRANRS